MQKAQSGFTLIELIIVIVILGILAAVALPKYIDLKQDAATAAVSGVAGGLGSAMAVNFAGRTAKGITAATFPVANCTDGATVMQGGLPTVGGVYVITPAVIAPGLAVTCTLTFTPTGGLAVVSTFTGLGIL